MATTETTKEADLPAMLANYKGAVEDWIKAIQAEEALASVHPNTIEEVDRWEHAHFAEEEARDKAKLAKKEYEDAIRRLYFDF